MRGYALMFGFSSMFFFCRQKSKSMDEKTDRALRDIQPIEVDGSVRFSSVSYDIGKF